jgi:hypothetical protein
MRRQRGRKLGTRRLRVLAGAALLALAAVGCRTSRPEDAAEALEAENRPWYDASGQGAPCAAAPATCPTYKDEKGFVDACVDKGFQAKSCGCGIRCSGKIAFKESGLGLAGHGHTTVPEAGCTAHDRDLIQRLAPHRPPQNARDRCLDAFVCRGEDRGCSDGDGTDARRLRAMAAKDCRDDVVAGICGEGAVDSFACPDEVVRRASVEWARVDEGQMAIEERRCLRNVLCSDRATGCSDAGQAAARALQHEIERSGCDYWTRRFCALGRMNR